MSLDHETPAVNEELHLETGLCARPWCEDAALPNEEFCADCLADVLAIEDQLLGGEAA